MELLLEVTILAIADVLGMMLGSKLMPRPESVVEF